MDWPKTRALIKGTLTFIPGMAAITQRKSGGTTSARYCYSVWLRHCVSLHAAGVSWPVQRIAELGPGDSLGIGLAALLAGAESYYAFDVKPFQSEALNREMLKELAELFRSRAPIPDEKEFPDIVPRLKDYTFPSLILPPDLMERSLCPERIRKIDASLRRIGSAAEPGMINYKCPWHAQSGPEAGSVDLVFSQAVMEHVEHVADTYRNLHTWLRPGGYMSHSIDFRCHKRSSKWYGHWEMSELCWRIVRGRRTYLLNRLPVDAHLRIIEDVGCELISVSCKEDISAPVERLANSFRNFSERDRRTACAYVLARKRKPISSDQAK